MFKKIKIFVLVGIFALSGCLFQGKDSGDSSNNSGKNTKQAGMSISDYQKIFDNAFLATQEHQEQKSKASITFNIQLNVSDNENNVLPEELESLKSSIIANYDFEDEENASGDLLLKMFFNKSDKSDFEFFTKLENKKITYILRSFEENTAMFLGLQDLLGGSEGIKAIQDNYVNKENSFELTDDQYKEMVTSFKSANEKGEIVVNSEEEEQKIAQAFVDNNVIKITEGKIENNDYILGFTISGEAIVNFLNEVAEINNLERDFSNELANFEKMDISGSIKISKNLEILNIDAEIFADKSLIKNADKDLIISVNYTNSSNNFDIWNLSLIDSEKNTEQASLTIDYKVE